MSGFDISGVELSVSHESVSVDVNLVRLLILNFLSVDCIIIFLSQCHCISFQLDTSIFFITRI